MINQKDVVLVITACLSPCADVLHLELRDGGVRKKQYIETIEWALNSTEFEWIVFVDNSNVKDEWLNRFVEKAEKVNKKFEWLSFMGDTKQCAQKGKGYGEGELIEYALKHSKILHQKDYFCKITGRLTVSNIGEVFPLRNRRYSFFVYDYPEMNKIDTRFYCIKKEFYEKYFREIYKNVDDRNSFFLEYAFGKAIKDNKLVTGCFRRYPIVCGISGSRGVAYTTSKNAPFYNFFTCIGVANTKIFRGFVRATRKLERRAHSCWPRKQ